jgi:hypothetical protein
MPGMAARARCIVRRAGDDRLLTVAAMLTVAAIKQKDSRDYAFCSRADLS